MSTRARLALVLAFAVALAAPPLVVSWVRHRDHIGSAGGPPAPTSTTSTPLPVDSGGAVPIDVEPTGRDVVAPGAGAVVGVGPTLRYTVAVEEGVPIDPAGAAAEVEAILADPRGWNANPAFGFQRIDDPASAAIRITIATAATVTERCAPLRTSGRFSCTLGGQVSLDAGAWIQGDPASGFALADLHAFLVNHEVGHALGQPDEVCPAPGAIAPVMLQQQIGAQGCVPNPWPYPPPVSGA